MPKWTITNSLQTLLLIAAVVLILMMSLNKCSNDKNDNKELVDLISALTDSLRTYKKNDSVNAARITAIQTESTKTFLQLQTKDREIQDLQATVKEYKKKLVAGSSVTNGSIETNVKHSGTTVITKTDTIRGKDSLVYVYPTYKDTIDNQWIKYEVIANKDSVETSIKVKNDFSVIIGKDKGKPFAELLTKNPYSETKQLRTYQVTVPKPKRISIGPNVSYGLGQNFKTQVFVGIGVQYTILRL